MSILLSINFISVFISLYVYLASPYSAYGDVVFQKQNLQSKCSDKFDEFFFCLFFSFFFGFSHFLSRVVFLLYIICFCFYFLITLQMRIYLGFSRLLFLSYVHISFAFSGLFLLLSLISAFSE